jgi:hypothetical protein
MTIDYVVKKKAIDLHLQGRGRNEIARILNSQKMRISEATITHLIQDWDRQQQKQEHNNSGPSSTLNAEVVTSQPHLLQSRQPQHQQPPESPQSSHSPQSPQAQVFQGPPSEASTGIDMNNTGSSSLIARPGVGQANIETNFVTVKRNGGPLSQFLPSDTDTTTVDPNPIAKAKITTPAFAAIFTDKKEEDVMSEEDDVNTLAKESDHMPFIKVEDPEAQIDIEDIDYIATNRHIHTQIP